MEIREITTEDLWCMREKEGLILQGCGGNLSEWVNGINDILTQGEILKEGTKFEQVFSFSYGELTCLLYPFEDVKLDIGKLAVWRIGTQDIFGGTWLSDFVSNCLGGFIGEDKTEPEKPDCALIGQNGNIFNLVGLASHTLKEYGKPERAKEMADRVFASGSYGEALCIIGEYVNITGRGHEQQSSVRKQLKETKPAE